MERGREKKMKLRKRLWKSLFDVWQHLSFKQPLIIICWWCIYILGRALVGENGDTEDCCKTVHKLLNIKFAARIHFFLYIIKPSNASKKWAAIFGIFNSACGKISLSLSLSRVVYAYVYLFSSMFWWHTRCTNRVNIIKRFVCKALEIAMLWRTASRFELNIVLTACICITSRNHG